VTNIERVHNELRLADTAAEPSVIQQHQWRALIFALLAIAAELSDLPKDR
jgi:hypothetical protein